eukprot:gnl/TRDRNA2_/TRDRNA2_168801_c0_seq1.p1 gnl/TRDRNA2_/TRDRNA2_168801_c0~~gnl/TRDRNA2_/TRDRNA2_168801_c0_seq1.p1  ORF type:complete len:478 (+),score=28.88 gnl/TRDRNA2_/TRDRNA2_168801_c0_seq1:121-1554(+)
MHLAKSAALAPELDNNSTYVLFLTPNLLLGSVCSILSGDSSSAFSESLAPVRTLTLLLYGCAALAKLNHGFLDLGVSGNTLCIVRLLKMFPDSIWPASLDEPLLESSEELARDSPLKRVLLFSSVITMMAEFAVPAALFCGCSWGIILALVMHLLMGGAGFWVFSVVMQSAVCLLWAPQTCPVAFRFMLLDPVARVAALSATLLVVALTNNSTIQFPRAIAQASRDMNERFKFLPGETGSYIELVWLIWSLLMLWGAVRSGLAVESDVPLLPHVENSLLSVVAWLTIACGVLLGASPYLGLRTHATWSMFSNLRLEGSQSNHLIIPAWTQPFSFLRDVVVVLESDDPGIARFSFGVDNGHGSGPRLAHLMRRIGAKPVCYFNAHGCYGAGADLAAMIPYGVPYLQLRRLVSRRFLQQKGDFFVRYIRADKEHLFQTHQGVLTPDSDALLAQQPSWLVRKLLIFRSFNVGPGPQVCCS